MEVEEGETRDKPSNVPIDYSLYRKFWALQDFFRKPSQLYDKNLWKQFITVSIDFEISLKRHLYFTTKIMSNYEKNAFFTSEFLKKKFTCPVA